MLTSWLDSESDKFAYNGLYEPVFLLMLESVKYKVSILLWQEQ